MAFGLIARPERLLAGLAATALALAGGVAMAQDKNAERAARRQQLQLQNLQQQVQETQAAKAKAEADKEAADKQVAAAKEQLGGLKSSLGKSTASLKAAETARAELAAQLAAANAAFAKQAAEQKRGSDEALAAKDQELARITKLREGQLAQLQKQRDEQATQVADCAAKNERLITLGAELLDRYRRKSVADVMAQTDPVLGLGDVKMFNLLQEVRDRAEAERFPGPGNR